MFSRRIIFYSVFSIRNNLDLLYHITRQMFHSSSKRVWFFNGKKCESLILKSLFFRKNWKAEPISVIFTAVWKAYKLTPTGWKGVLWLQNWIHPRNLLCHALRIPRPLASRESAAHSQSQEQVPPKTGLFLTVISPGNASSFAFFSPLQCDL